MRVICKQTKLETSFYEDIYSTKVNGASLVYIESRFPVTAFLIKCDSDLNIIKKLDTFISFGTGAWLSHFDDDSLNELWQLFKNAPFWKDYAVWKKLHNMSEDF